MRRAVFCYIARSLSFQRIREALGPQARSPVLLLHICKTTSACTHAIIVALRMQRSLSAHGGHRAVLYSPFQTASARESFLTCTARVEKVRS